MRPSTPTRFSPATQEGSTMAQQGRSFSFETRKQQPTRTGRRKKSKITGDVQARVGTGKTDQALSYTFCLPSGVPPARRTSRCWGRTKCRSTSSSPGTDTEEYKANKKKKAQQSRYTELNGGGFAICQVQEWRIVGREFHYGLARATLRGGTGWGQPVL